MMKKILITGATGYIGGVLARHLVAQGHDVVALARIPPADTSDKTEPRWVQADLHDAGHLNQAMHGVEEVYHLAAYARPWAKNPSYYHQINVEGTENVLKAAEANGVRRVVFTSTAGVFGPSKDHEQVDESSIPWKSPYTEYDRSKIAAEAIARKRAAGGQEIVIVNPTRVYGPGDPATINAVNKMIQLYLKGRFRFLPGDGSGLGNYAYIVDVVNGHLLAMQKGISGENYILGGVNISFRDFFRHLAKASGKHYSIFPMPIGLMKLAAKAMQWRADRFGTPPAITPEWVDRYEAHWMLSPQKAVENLGYQITPLDEGLKKTVSWLESL
ncbi:MAG: NAD-dependent epimerase/dehydratase family protein [Saprospiraceae bacterium]|nr:NAD-dependent epimerase/dehydratase family protein [Saprospiraceae bacterium]